MSKNTDLGSLVNYIKGQVTGRLNAPAYTSATAFTGTIAGYLGFDTSGNILTSAGVGFTGSGTTNYIPKFTGSTSLGNSNIQDTGSALTFGVGATFSSSVTARNFTINEASVGRGGLYPYNLVLGSGTDYSVGIFSISEIYLATGNSATKQVVISSTGNVGIGTNLPLAILDVRKATASGDTQFNFVNSQNSSSGNTLVTSTIYLGFYDDSNGLANVNKIVSGKSGDYTSAPTANSFLAFYTTNANTSAERMRISSTGAITFSNTITSVGSIGVGTTAISGYAMNITGVDGTNYSPSSLYKIIARFVNNTTENRGIGIGYHTSTDINAACIYSLGQGSAAFPQATLAFGVYNRSTSAYTIKFLINQNTVYIGDIPSSDAGRSTGELYRDALGYVKIVY